MKKYTASLIILLICACMISANENVLDDQKLSISTKISGERDSEEISDLLIDKLQMLSAVKETGLWSSLFRFRNYNRKISESEYNEFSEYYYNRFNVGYKKASLRIESGFVVLRETFQPAFNALNFDKYFLKKYFLLIERQPKIGRFILGNYRLNSGQGLVFYDSLAEFVRPIKNKPMPIRPDLGLSDQNYLKGVAWENENDKFGISLFFSQKDLNGSKENNEMDVDLYSIREVDNDFISKSEINRYHTFEETLIGGRVFSKNEFLYVGISGYESSFNYKLNPEDTTNYYSHVYRGDKNTVLGFDFNYYYNDLNIFGELAVSKAGGGDLKTNQGNGWTITPVYDIEPFSLFSSIYYYDPYFFNRHAQGTSFDGEPPNNERGVISGVNFKDKGHSLLTHYRIARNELSNWKGTGQSTSAHLPGESKAVYFEYSYKLAPGVDLYFRQWNSFEDKYLDIDNSDVEEFKQVVQEKTRSRYQISLKKKKASFKIRYDKVKEKVETLSTQDEGDLFFSEIGYKLSDVWDVSGRAIFFDTEGVYLNEYEPNWYRIYQSYSFRSNPGVRYYLVSKLKITNHLLFWAKLGQTVYDNLDKSSTDFRTQLDLTF
ncbi:MAG: hypothetical protein ABII27_02835 [bacterium]